MPDFTKALPRFRGLGQSLSRIGAFSVRHRKKAALLAGLIGAERVYAAMPASPQRATVKRERQISPLYGPPTLGKATYTASKHKRDERGRFAGVGDAIHSAIYGDDKDAQPSALRTSRIAGAVEGFKAVGAIGGITLSGAAARAVNEHRMAAVMNGKGGHDRNLAAEKLRNHMDRDHRAILAAAREARASMHPDAADIKAAAYRSARANGMGHFSANAHAATVVQHVGDKVAGSEIKRLSGHLERLAASADHTVSMSRALGLHGRAYLPALAVATGLGFASAHRAESDRDGYDVSVPMRAVAGLGDTLRVAGEVGIAHALPHQAAAGLKRLAALSGYGHPQILRIAERHTGAAGAALAVGAGLIGARSLLREQKRRSAQG